MSQQGSGTSFSPSSPEEISEIVRTQSSVLPIGHGTKTGLTKHPEGCAAIKTENLNGIVEYAPEEFTITVQAGTPVASIQSELEENGQFLPFDPPLVDKGATIGGTVASGLSGPGRQRYGGIRDFILGVRFIDGRGVHIRGGGKVVKNSAGFDLPKLMVGSIGRLGILTEATFKVFPKPERFQTLKIQFQTVDQAKDGVGLLLSQSLDLAGLELESDGSLYVRVGGVEGSLTLRISRIQTQLRETGEVFSGEPEARIWRDFREFNGANRHPNLLKVPISPLRISDTEKLLADREAIRRYGAGGSVAWIGLPDAESVQRFAEDLAANSLSAIVFMGETSTPLLGDYPGHFLLNRIQKAIDPEGRFLPF